MASILCSISIYVHLWEEADKTILRDFQRVNAFYLFFLIEDDTFTNTDIFGSRQITLKSHVAMFMISKATKPKVTSIYKPSAVTFIQKLLMDTYCQINSLSTLSSFDM